MTAGDNTAIVIAEHGCRIADQIRPEYPFAADIKIIAIDQGNQWLHQTA